MIVKDESSYFDLFRLPKTYNIDKNALKKTYYTLSKEVHPDLVENTEKFSMLNKAFSTLNDDFLRAKLFTSTADKVDNSFLIECIELEDRIEQGEDLKPMLIKKIDECKDNYKNRDFICKWGYYKRLLDIIKAKE